LTYGTPHIPFIAVFLYLIVVWTVPKIFKPLGRGEKAPRTFLDTIVDATLPLWNLGLSLMSLLIVIGVGVPYFRLIRNRGFWAVYCDESQFLYEGKTGMMYWAYLFALSKYYELFDTAFLLAKRRPVMFLHWYHHCTVLLFTWFAEYWRFSMGYIFILVNAFVHTIMYFYYFLTGMKVKVPNSIAFSITILQITQMFVGIGTNGYWIYYYFTGPTTCSNESPWILMSSCIVMYGSYLFLFLQFFVKRYLGSGKPATSSKGSQKPATSSKGSQKPKTK